MTKKEREFIEALEAVGDPKKSFIRAIKKEVNVLLQRYAQELEEAQTPQEKIEVDKRWQALKYSIAEKIVYATISYDEK